MVAALKINVRQISGVDGKRRALERPPLLVDQAGRIFFRPPEKRTPEHETATPAASHAFTPAQLLLILDIRCVHGAEQEPSDLIRQLAHG